uniref:Uncharacterized protein n=1 Tax=Cannabis sativa TaxID=3483 RepID=A0A803PKW8_CANSA
MGTTSSGYVGLKSFTITFEMSKHSHYLKENGGHLDENQSATIFRGHQPPVVGKGRRMNNKSVGYQENARREPPALCDPITALMVNPVNKNVQLPRKSSLVQSLLSHASSNPDTSRHGPRKEEQVC